MIRMGIGVDAHRFVEGRALMLGGVQVPHTMGLAGHSDADVVCHALVDALLGAVAAGDIGSLFPDSDPAWKDASSLEFLRGALALLTERDAAILNVDVTVLAERPKLAPHRDAMRQAVAGALGLGVERVSIKATTVERMGAIGREEGIAAMAVATVEVGEGKSERGTRNAEC